MSDLSGAEIATLGISIKVLCVGKKPMTVAVFKQLPVIDHTDFDGDIVGFVRYSHCNNGLWFLCAAGGILYKSASKSVGADYLAIEWGKLNHYEKISTKSDFDNRRDILSRLQSIHDYEVVVRNTKPQIFIAA